MGVHPNVNPLANPPVWPKQGALVGQPVRLCFNYQASKAVSGVCVRDDVEAPYVTLFKLASGEHVLATECQYATA
jgi:hypothetical protein